jgi:transglutaminase-like putative cysteine protease
VSLSNGMLYTIVHETTYRYPERVRESYTICHLQPRTDQTQYCTKYELVVEPRTPIFSYQDRFGNDVQHFSYLPDHEMLSVKARSSVVTAALHDPALPGPVSRRELHGDPRLPQLYDFLHESVYVEFGESLEEFARNIGDCGDDLTSYFLRAGEAINRQFEYDKDATSVHTRVEESVRLRRGVCQDFAHLHVALCRYHGIPARYVSGYVCGGQENSVLGAEASHAWCEAYLPPYGWIAYDPTHARLVNDEFVKIAVGRDYRDVSPVRGVYKGASQSMMCVNVAVEALAT